jgi:hypothetical protein
VFFVWIELGKLPHRFLRETIVPQPHHGGWKQPGE